MKNHEKEKEIKYYKNNFSTAPKQILLQETIELDKALSKYFV